MILEFCWVDHDVKNDYDVDDPLFKDKYSSNICVYYMTVFYPVALSLVFKYLMFMWSKSKAA